MNNEVFDIVLLLALPASGKSEVRELLAHIEPQQLKKEFHIGANCQLDDFPYVNMMRRIDDELEALGQPRLFYRSGQDSFLNDYDWGTLTHLLNEDYHDLVNRNVVSCGSAALRLFTRIDGAALKVGITPRLGMLPQPVRTALAEKLEGECRRMLDDKQAGYCDLTGRTIVIEMARGGHDGAAMPLNDPFGYQYTLRQFCPEILERAAILYIWVTPEESRRKNFARANPNDPGSNLFHGVPLNVMMYDYGCDDMEYLRQNSEVEDTVTVRSWGSTYHLPIGVFDNRTDKTTFLRQDAAAWDPQQVAEVTEAIRRATDAMAAHYQR
jgi:hypothetical protein